MATESNVVDDVQGSPEVEQKDQERHSLDILGTVKKCQLQNGVRHDDYQRYRQYCTRRLKRIRKNRAVEFSHRGQRGKFEKQELTKEICSNSLYFLIPLMNAERAWGYAMQLKQDNELNGEDLRRTAHMIRRLAKAAKWSRKLKEICAAVGDDRTALQAEAYSAWMNGNFFLEKDELKEALPLFSQAKQVYSELSKVSTYDQKELMQEKLDNLELVILYCTRYLSQEGTNAKELADMMSRSKDSSGLIQSKLSKVISESMKEQAHEGYEVSLFGRSIPVRNESTAVLLLSAQSNVKSLESLTSAIQTLNELEWEKVDNLFVETFSKYDDAARNIRNDTNKAESSNISTADLPKERFVGELKLLRLYVKVQKLEKVINRNDLLSQRLEKQYEEQVDNQFANDFNKGVNVTEKTSSDKSKGKTKKSSKRSMKSQNLQRMFDKLLQNITTQLEVMEEAGKEAESEETANAEAARLYELQKLVEAKRSYYEGRGLNEANRPDEALSAFEHSLESIQDLLSADARENLGAEDFEALVEFQKRIAGERRVSQARVLLSEARSSVGGEDKPASGQDPIVSVAAPPALVDIAMKQMHFPDFSKGGKSSEKGGWLKKW
eukprot:CAMPEP_0184022804 /NCGR_PEP_ID=MMETSP0954-20121128/10876_1 /TAXON_ID=627963 /ORGANISM="Aplanochytrium sp, Strain PBS07" /LENGTH=608 /DNA_ID=CAMNT_0026305353 /DNA_START=44 /DNA_END=1867 /DNA_ORIENTATION=-